MQCNYLFLPKTHEKECDYIEVPCSNQGCTIPMELRKKMKEHEKDCQFRLVLCSFCKVKEMPFNEIRVSQFFLLTLYYADLEMRQNFR